MNTSAHALASPGEKPATLPHWIRSVVIAGYFLPSLIGLVVWLYLQAAGKSVMPFGWIIRMIPAFCIFSAIWVLPFLAIFLVARFLSLTNRKSAGLVYGAFLGTALSEIVVFGIAWTDVEIIVMGLLLLPAAVFAGTLAGGAIGFLYAWLAQKISSPRTNASSPSPPL